jgi:hypothetical protein
VGRRDPATLESEAIHQAAVEEAVAMMNVYFTVDTEASMGGAWSYPERRPVKADRHVFCRVGDRDYGIGLITRILQEHGFQATHFVETMASLVDGEREWREVVDYLQAHGQDVQLHVHPTYRFYAEALVEREAGRNFTPPKGNDQIRTFSEERQFEILEHGCEIFERFTGRRPVAFRAGCYAANRTTLRCLKRLGLLLDTSFNPCYPGESFTGEHLEMNRVQQIEGIWELPVTAARTPLPEGHGLKPADPCALSVRELQAMMEAGEAGGQRHFVMVFHSFSAVKASDIFYTGIKPDRVVIRRLQKLMRYLADHPTRYRVSTFAELATGITHLESSLAPVAALGLVASGVRKVVQGLNRHYWF